MAITKLDTGVVTFSNAKALLFTPYTDVDTIGATSYDLVSIVADTISLTPDDNTVNSKESEFSSTPLFENITLGPQKFAATCTDLQNTIMKEIMGWTVDAVSGSVFAPTQYVDLYVKIEIQFKNTATPSVIIPKLKLNSKTIISSLKTGSGECQMAGTAYEENIKVGEVTIKSPCAMIPADTTYLVGSEIV
jgi:hypothetical protein